MPRLYVARSLGLILLLSFFALAALRSFPVNTEKHSKTTPPYVGPQVANNNELAHGFIASDLAQEFCKRHRMSVYLTRNRPRRIYDLFLINTELDWLELRLEELYDKVDYFVVLESESTFQEGQKPLYLLENWARFEKYHPKIIRRTLGMSGGNLPKGDTWEHERYSRNALFDIALRSLDDDQRPEQGDVIIVSDVDELPRPETIIALRNCAFPPRVTLRSAFYYYSFQWLHRGEQWAHPQATYFNGFDNTIRPEDLRTGKPDLDLYNAAWHCSTCLPTLANVMNKIASFSHQGYNHPYFLDRSRLLRNIRNGDDLFARKSEIYDRIDNNRDVPKHLLTAEGRIRYSYMLDRDPPHANFRDGNEQK